MYEMYIMYNLKSVYLLNNKHKLEQICIFIELYGYSTSIIAPFLIVCTFFMPVLWLFIFVTLEMQLQKSIQVIQYHILLCIQKYCRYEFKLRHVICVSLNFCQLRSLTFILVSVYMLGCFCEISQWNSRCESAADTFSGLSLRNTLEVLLVGNCQSMFISNVQCVTKPRVGCYFPP